MPFDPEVEKLFQIMKASGIPPLASLTVDQARHYYREKTKYLGGTAAPVKEVRNAAASGPLGGIPLRIYRPENAPALGPAMIYVHGGGWVIGDFDSHDKICRAIAARTPCKVVAIGYRLAPEFPLPAGVDDVIAAMKWIAANASALGIDPARIAIGGDSAGGNMSAAACLEARATGPALCAQVLIYPSTDITAAPEVFPSRSENAEVPPLTADAIRWFAEKYLPKANIDTMSWKLSPLRAESFAGLPPTLILTAEYDMLRDEGKAYAGHLSAAGVPTIHCHFPGQVHGFVEFGGLLSAAGQAIGKIAGFLRSHFA